MSGRPQTTDDPEALAVLDEIDEACRAVAEDETQLAGALSRRNALFLKARRLDVTQRQIAQVAGISEPAVAKALAKAEAEG